MLGLAYGAIGTAIALGIALYRYHTVRLPPVTLYPGAILNAIATAFFDEAVFRGLLFGFLLSTGLEPNVANLIQALIYALATRLGAPGRPWYMLITALAIGLAGGWLTGITGGIGAAFLGPCDHARGDLPDDGPRRDPEGEGHRGRGGRPAAGHAQGLAGARVGRGHAGPLARAACAGGRHDRRATARLRSTSTSRSASRSARTATSWSTRVPRRAGRGLGSMRSPGALLTEIGLRADAADAAFGGRAAAAGHPLHRRRDADPAAVVLDRRD